MSVHKSGIPEILVQLLCYPFYTNASAMKKLLVIALLGIGASFSNPIQAQVSVNINIGAQPSWGPSGYNYVNYYYLPEIETYYHVPTRKYIYYDRNRWVHVKHLPSRYRGYDLHRGRKVVINRDRPYLSHRPQRAHYVSNSRHVERKQRISYERRERSHPGKKHGNKHHRDHGPKHGRY